MFFKWPWSAHWLDPFTAKPQGAQTMFLEKTDRLVNRLIFHYLGPVSKPTFTADAEEINRWHVLRGFNEIGYHGLIMPTGKFEIGRSVHKMGAHCKGSNRGSIGICLSRGLAPGQEAPAKFTKAMMDTARAVAIECQNYYPEIEIGGHRDFGASQCPSFDVSYWLQTGEIRV